MYKEELQEQITRCREMQSKCNAERIRERRKMWEQRLPDVYDILYQGSMKAKTVAANTLEEVKHSMKIDYFENKNLLSKENER